MSIHFISGKPGGGKTLYSVKLILEELLYGTRTIITNVPMNLVFLNEYLQEKYPSRSINLFDRILLIDEEQMGVFYTIRPHGSQGPTKLTKEQWERGETPDYSKISDHGVVYVLDEIHIKFNARAWMETGRDVLFYLSQHRKLGDTVICITQAVNNVDKQFRSVTQDYTYIRNLGKEKLSKFRLPNIFIRQTYNTPATDNSTPMETGTFRLDVSGLAKCYDTAKGVGIHGRAGADTTERKKGLPWWVAAVAVVVLVLLVAKIVPQMIANLFKGPQVAKAVASVTPTVKQAAHGLFEAKTEKTNTVAPGQQLSQQASNEVVYCTGYDVLLGRFQIYLSDGRWIYEGDTNLNRIERNRGVVYGGRLYPFKRPEAGEMPAPKQDAALEVASPSMRYRVHYGNGGEYITP